MYKFTCMYHGCAKYKHDTIIKQTNIVKTCSIEEVPFGSELCTAVPEVQL